MLGLCQKFCSPPFPFAYNPSRKVRYAVQHIPLKISFSFWSKFSSSSSNKSYLQEGHMTANANIKDAVDVPGQKVGKERER